MINPQGLPSRPRAWAGNQTRHFCVRRNRITSPRPVQCPAIRRPSRKQHNKCNAPEHSAASLEVSTSTSRAWFQKSQSNSGTRHDIGPTLSVKDISLDRCPALPAMCRQFVTRQKGLIAVSGKQDKDAQTAQRQAIAARLSRLLDQNAVDGFFGRVSIEVFIEDGQIKRCVPQSSETVKLT